VSTTDLEKLAGRAAKLPVGDPHREPVALGPLIDERQLRTWTGS
jgi:acyl-CoA reductase-like NAD-dependent aldehyde dehydrogenase